MQSIEFASSPDDPSPKIAELVESTLRLSLTNPEYDVPSPETEPLTLHSYDGAVILQKLLPDLAPNTLWALRDAIAEQDAPAEALLVVEPSSLLGGWLKKARALLTPKYAEPTPEPIEPLDDIEIIEPVEGRTKQIHLKALPEHHAIVVRRSSFKGAVRVNGVEYVFNPDNTVLEVGAVPYNPEPGQYADYFAHKSRRHYTFVESTGELYRSKQYGGSLDDKKLETDAERVKAFHKMARILEEAQTTSEPALW